MNGTFASTGEFNGFDEAKIIHNNLAYPAHSSDPPRLATAPKETAASLPSRPAFSSGRTPQALHAGRASQSMGRTSPTLAGVLALATHRTKRSVLPSPDAMPAGRNDRVDYAIRKCFLRRKLSRGQDPFLSNPHRSPLCQPLCAARSGNDP